MVNRDAIVNDVSTMNVDAEMRMREIDAPMHRVVQEESGGVAVEVGSAGVAERKRERMAVPLASDQKELAAPPKRRDRCWRWRSRRAAPLRDAERDGLVDQVFGDARAGVFMATEKCASVSAIQRDE